MLIKISLVLIQYIIRRVFLAVSYHQFKNKRFLFSVTDECNSMLCCTCQFAVTFYNKEKLKNALVNMYAKGYHNISKNFSYRALIYVL